MELQGGFLVSQIQKISRRILDQILADNKVTQFNGAQGSILYILWQEDMIPISHIAAKTGLAKTSLTSMLDHMEKDGLIARTFSPKDRRKIFISLTPKSKKLQSQYEEVSKEMNDIFYVDFSSKEILSFEKTLAKILDNLEQGEKQIKNK